MEDLVQVLTKFHREIVLPDVQRVVDGLRTEMNVRFDDVYSRFDVITGHLDAIYHRFDRLETEYNMVVAGLKRIEERLDRVEARL